MEGFEIGVSINPIDLLKHITEIYKTKQYAEIELTKIVEETKRFNNQLLKDTYAFNAQFEEVKKINEVQRKMIMDLTNKIIEHPELTAVYQPIIISMTQESTKFMEWCTKI